MISGCSVPVFTLIKLMQCLLRATMKGNDCSSKPGMVTMLQQTLFLTWRSSIILIVSCSPAGGRCFDSSPKLYWNLAVSACSVTDPSASPLPAPPSPRSASKKPGSSIPKTSFPRAYSFIYVMFHWPKAIGCSIRCDSPTTCYPGLTIKESTLSRTGFYAALLC